MMLCLHIHLGSHEAVFCMMGGMQKIGCYDLKSTRCTDLIVYHIEVWTDPCLAVYNHICHYQPTCGTVKNLSNPDFFITRKKV